MQLFSPLNDSCWESGSPTLIPDEPRFFTNGAEQVGSIFERREDVLIVSVDAEPVLRPHVLAPLSRRLVQLLPRPAAVAVEKDAVVSRDAG